MTMKWRPRFTYSPANTVLNLSRPVRAWTPAQRTRGGFAELAGVQESYLQWRHELLKVTLVFYESEYAAVMAFVRWAMDNAGSTFKFRPNRDNAALERDVYLDSPRVGERDVEPLRVVGFARAWELDVVLRMADGQPFTTAYVSG